jgi:regulator of protease activity HflC (stomatin/prohibitin superfamily)
LRGGTPGSKNGVNAKAAANPPVPVSYTIENPYFSSQKARAEQERLAAAKKAREQAQAARIAQERAEAEQRELQKGADRTATIPLDHPSIVPNVGGSDVTVKIHDNDVASFDVWINGTKRRQVTKRKAVTGSRIDEALIYSNGRSRLYVSEISGKQNHCLLRVREE